MANSELLYGPSFSALRREAFSRAASNADNHPGSMMLFENNESQRNAHIDIWAGSTDRNPLQLNTEGLTAFVSTAHDRLVDLTPIVGTLERQRTIEQALEELTTIDNARQFSDSFSELFRALEAHGQLTADDVTDALTESDLNPQYVDEITTAFEQYCHLRGELAHPEACTLSQQFLEVANAPGSLADAFPEVNHVIVSGYTDPSPVELKVLRRVIESFPTTVTLPALHSQCNETGVDRPKPTGTDTALRSSIEGYEELGLNAEYIGPSDTTLLQELSKRLYTADATGDDVDAEELVSWHEAPTADREVRHLARRLRKQLATTDTNPEDILILAPGLLSYRDRVGDIFAEYGIPHIASISILLERTYIGQAVLDAVALCTNPESGQLARLATNPVVTLQGIDPTDLTSLINRIPSTDPNTLLHHADESWRDSLTTLHG